MRLVVTSAWHMRAAGRVALFFGTEFRLPRVVCSSAPTEPRLKGSIGRVERHKQVPAGASRTASLKVLQDGIANLTLERIALWPSSFRMIHLEHLFTPIEIAQHESRHFATAQSINREQREDCSCSQRSLALTPSPISGACALLPNLGPRADPRIYRFLALECPSRNLWRTIRVSRRNERRRAGPVQRTANRLAIPSASAFHRKELVNIFDPRPRQQPMPLPEPFQELRCLRSSRTEPNTARDPFPLSCSGAKSQS